MHLGLTVVDTGTWTRVDLPHVTIQFVRDAGPMVIGVDSASSSPWIDEIHAFRFDDTGSISSHGPFEIESGGCTSDRDGERLICSGFTVQASQTFTIIDLATSEITEGPEIGSEDYIEQNGIIVDWNPGSSIGGG